MNNNHIKQLILVIAILIITLASFASYAYFTADVQGNDTAANNVITTGNMEITYEDGSVIGTTSNMIPGDSIEKHFSVKNTGTVDSVYDLYLNSVINTFNTREDLVYELISENGANINQTTCPYLNSKIASAIQIGVGITHNYTLKITFKNEDKVQDDNQGALFSAKVDLEEKQNNIATTIVNNKLIGATDLEYDYTEDNNLRYIGQTPNNYIYFDCSTTNVDEMNDETCEKWQIIGVMNNIEDELGNKESRVKIIRHNYLGQYSWAVTDESANNSGYGFAQWGESTYGDGTPYEGAILMRELNTDYLGNITIGTDGMWVTGGYTVSKNRAPMPNPLTESSVNMIQEVKWYLGSPTIENGALASNSWSFTSSTLYARERKSTYDYLCIDPSNCVTDIKRTNDWVGKVALMYPSDFSYTTNGNGQTTRDECLNQNVNSYCGESSWMKITNSTFGDYEWTLTTSVRDSNLASSVFYTQGGDVSSYNAYHAYYVRPTLYLKSNVVIVDGNGSETNPYKLTM